MAGKCARLRHLVANARMAFLRSVIVAVPLEASDEVHGGQVLPLGLPYSGAAWDHGCLQTGSEDVGLALHVGVQALTVMHTHATVAQRDKGSWPRAYETCRPSLVSLDRIIGRPVANPAGRKTADQGMSGLKLPSIAPLFIAFCCRWQSQKVMALYAAAAQS